MSALTRSTSILPTCLLLAVHGLHFSSGPATGAPKKLTLSELAAERRKDCPARIDTTNLPPVWAEDERQALLNASRRRSNTAAWPTSSQPNKKLFGNAGLYPNQECVTAPPLDPAYCPLRICTHAGALVPRLFVDLVPDEEPTAILNIMEGMLVANENGMNFGGALHQHVEDSLPAFDTQHVVTKFFNLTNPQWIVWGGPPPCFKGVFQSVKALESHRPDLKDGENIYLPTVKELSASNFADYMDSEFLTELRWGLKRYPLAFRPNELTVAMHVVRDRKPWEGDYDPRYNYYYEMAKSIRKMYPHADIHAFSSKFVGMYRLWNTTDLEGFESHDITLHLDECDTVDTWAHMSLAHVFVMSREATAFSKIPAMLNPNCVIYSFQDEDRFRGMKRKHLLGSNSVRAHFQEDLRACIAGYPPPCPGCTSTTKTTVTHFTRTATTSTRSTTSATLAVR